MALTGLVLLGTVVYFGETPNSTDHSRGMHVLITIGDRTAHLCLLSAMAYRSESSNMDGPSSGVGRSLLGRSDRLCLVVCLGRLRHRSDWSLSLSRVNRLGLYSSLALLLAIQSPLLDFGRSPLPARLNVLERK